jgi:hypothetical protein
MAWNIRLSNSRQLIVCCRCCCVAVARFQVLLLIISLLKCADRFNSWYTALHASEPPPGAVSKRHHSVQSCSVSAFNLERNSDVTRRYGQHNQHKGTQTHAAPTAHTCVCIRARSAALHGLLLHVPGVSVHTSTQAARRLQPHCERCCDTIRWLKIVRHTCRASAAQQQQQAPGHQQATHAVS